MSKRLALKEKIERFFSSVHNTIKTHSLNNIDLTIKVVDLKKYGPFNLLSKLDRVINNPDIMEEIYSEILLQSKHWARYENKSSTIITEVMIYNDIVINYVNKTEGFFTIVVNKPLTKKDLIAVTLISNILISMINYHKAPDNLSSNPKITLIIKKREN